MPGDHFFQLYNDQNKLHFDNLFIDIVINVKLVLAPFLSLPKTRHLLYLHANGVYLIALDLAL